MGCCASIPSSPSSPYPTAASSSSRAINAIHSQPSSHIGLPRPSTTQTNTSSQVQGHGHHQALTERFNRPLKLHRWSSKRRWTRRALDKERRDFFDTRVTGRPEIWMTLRAALEVLWVGDDGSDGSDEGSALATAQTILEAADVTIPTGDLANGAYDAFGALYSMPEWVVADPGNMVYEDETEMDGGLSKMGDNMVVQLDEEEEAARRREEKGKTVLLAADIIAVKARLSDRGGADVIVQAGKEDSVRSIIKRIFEESDIPNSKRIKIVYLGKLLKENESLPSQGWKNDHIINALVLD